MRVRGWASVSLLVVSGTVWLAAATLAPKQAPVPPRKINFSQDVLPILSEKCFKCHGPDAEGRQADLRLDTAAGAFADRGGRWPIVPGKPQDSLILKRIASGEMPPSSSGKSLTKAEIATLTSWIQQGARYTKLWSFEPIPAKVAVPATSAKWVRNEIDRFIFARLQQAKLTPSPAASRERWLRRVSFDLTGLPPTPAEISAFLGDASPKAYDTVVDRLLASSHFGERMAVDWLDAARYSDSYGYQSDLLSPTWPYRDWVVKAFNTNLPYNEFLTDNLAGDLLPKTTTDQRLATAFNRLHRQSNEGGSIAQEYLTEYSVDRVSTFGTAVLGLTLGCARCHDHKFDPITQKEFYQLYAYFNSINEYGLLLSTEIVPSPSMLLPTDRQAMELSQLTFFGVEAANFTGRAWDRARSRYPAWLASKPKPEIPGILAHYALTPVTGNSFPNDVSAKYQAEKLGSVASTNDGVKLDGDDGLALRGLPAIERWDPFTWSFWLTDARVAKGPVVLLQRTGGTDVGFCGIDLMLEDGYLTARVMRAWPGNALAVRTKYPFPKNVKTHIAWSYDGGGSAYGLKLYLDGKLAPTTVLVNQLWKKVHAYGDLGESGGDWAFGLRFRDAGLKGGTLRDVTYVNRAVSPLEAAQLYDGHALSDALAHPEADTQELTTYYGLAFDKDVIAADEMRRHSQESIANAEEKIYEVEVMQETDQPVPAYLLARGRYDAPRNAKTLVSRDVPKILPPLAATGANNRLALAKWATRGDNPLTARVEVNRLWQMMFGTGLVETSENFGVQGTPPTHPELLDYLARRFIDSGWDVKAMVRLMALSATYRQDSALTPKLRAADPLNRLYARGPSGRLSGEMVRDLVLSAAGLLNDKLGGAPVNPYQPAGLWTENNSMSPGFVQSKGADLYRRSLYSTWKRTAPVPSMLLFDATSREACAVRRPATNTPMQALVLLNDIQFVEAARVLADNVLKQSPNDTVRIQTAFQRLTGRGPDAREAQILLATLNDQRQAYKADPKAAAKLIAIGDSKPSDSSSPGELAAMTITVQTILNSDAAVWKR